MRAEEILEVDDLTFLEPSLDSMSDGGFNQQMAMMSGTKAIVVVNEEEWPIAAAIDDGGWKVGTFIYRGLSEEIIERLDEMDISLRRVKQEEWEGAVRAYYCERLMEQIAPYPEDFNADRAAKVRELLVQLWGEELQGSCLDVGCGSGMGSLVIRELGMRPVAYDNDPALITLGLSTGRLVPEDTCCLDASTAGNFVRPAERALVLMAGEINIITLPVWSKVVAETVHLAERVIVTTGNEEEAITVADWAREEGCAVQVLENERDPFYDRWVCDIVRE